MSPFSLPAENEQFTSTDSHKKPNSALKCPPPWNKFQHTMQRTQLILISVVGPESEKRDKESDVQSSMLCVFAGETMCGACVCARFFAPFSLAPSKVEQTVCGINQR